MSLRPQIAVISILESMPFSGIPGPYPVGGYLGEGVGKHTLIDECSRYFLQLLQFMCVLQRRFIVFTS